MNLTYRQRHAIIAALRYWQAGDPGPVLLALASNDGASRVLCSDEVDDLCEEINCS